MKMSNLYVVMNKIAANYENESVVIAKPEKIFDTIDEARNYIKNVSLDENYDIISCDLFDDVIYTTGGTIDAPIKYIVARHSGRKEIAEFHYYITYVK